MEVFKPGLDHFVQASHKARDYVRSYGKGAGVSGVGVVQGSSIDDFWLHCIDEFLASGSLDNVIFSIMYASLEFLAFFFLTLRNPKPEVPYSQSSQ